MRPNLRRTRVSQSGKMSGSPALTLPVNWAGRFSRNDITPSIASGCLPMYRMARESTRCAYIGWSATRPRHSMRRVERDGHGSRVGDLGRELAGRVEELAVWVHAANEPARQRLGGPEDPSGVEPLGGLSDADDSGQEPGGRAFGHDAATREHEPEPRRLAGEANVRGERHRRSHADGGAVDGGDHRLGACEQPHRDPARAVPAGSVGCRLGPSRPAVSERLAATRQVGTGTERLAPTGEDDGAYLVVAVDEVEHRDELADHRRRAGIHLLRPVQRNGGDVVGDVVLDLGELHARHRTKSGWAGSGRALRPPALKGPLQCPPTRLDEVAVGAVFLAQPERSGEALSGIGELAGCEVDLAEVLRQRCLHERLRGPPDQATVPIGCLVESALVSPDVGLEREQPWAAGRVSEQRLQCPAALPRGRAGTTPRARGRTGRRRARQGTGRGR